MSGCTTREQQLGGLPRFHANTACVHTMQSHHRLCMCGTCRYLHTDSAVALASAAANASQLLLQRRLLAGAPLAVQLGALASLGLSLGHAAAACQAHQQRYAARRDTIVAALRVARSLLAAVVGSSDGRSSSCSGATNTSSSWWGAALALAAASPGSSSLLGAVALPLRMGQHLALQACITLVAIAAAAAAPAGACCGGLLQLQQAPPAWLALLDVSLLAPLAAGLPPRTHGDGRCLPALATLAVAQGLVLSTAGLLTSELLGRLRFLRQPHVAEQLPRRQARALAGALRSVWLASCVAWLSLLPLVWQLAALAQQWAGAAQGHVQLALAVVTVLAMEALVRVWLVLVVSLVSALFLAATQWGD